MIATISSYDENKRFWGDGTKGKKMSVSSDGFKVMSVSDGLIVKACDTDWFGTGLRGGVVREIQRELTLKLTPSDLVRLFQAALDAGLVRPSLALATEAEAPKKPKRTRKE